MRKQNTYGVAQAVIERLKTKEEVVIKEYNIRDLELPFCCSCHQCFARGESFCPHRDIMKPVTDDMESCDGIILTGVVYSMHMNAAMKNFIDHLSYYYHRPRLFNKKGIVISTTAGAGDKIVTKFLKSTIGVWGVNNIAELNIKVRSYKFKLTEKQKELLNKKTDKFYFAIKDNKIAKPSFNSVIIYNAFRGMSSAENPVSECDKEYWNKSGLAKKVYPNKAGVLKNLLGRIVYRILKNVRAE
jgi:multimeric flavodoxin WrbA